MPTLTITTTGDGSWTAPLGLTGGTATIRGRGPGEGGIPQGSPGVSPSGGGGGGGWGTVVYTVTPGATYLYHVGAKGVGGLGPSADTVFDTAAFMPAGPTFEAGGRSGQGIGGSAQNVDAAHTGGAGAGASGINGGGGGSAAGPSGNGNDGLGTTGGAAVDGQGAGGNENAAGQNYGGGGGGAPTGGSPKDGGDGWLEIEWLGGSDAVVAAARYYNSRNSVIRFGDIPI